MLANWLVKEFTLNIEYIFTFFRSVLSYNVNATIVTTCFVSLKSYTL